MSKDREPQSVEDIEQRLRYQERSLSWDWGITGVSFLGGYLAMNNINMEPSILRAIIWMGPLIVAAGGFTMGLYRHEKIKYLQGLRDGILQETQRTSTLGNQRVSP